MMGHLCNVSTCAELNPLFEGGHVYLEQQEVWKNSMYTAVYGGDLEGVWRTNKRTYTYYRTFQKPSQGEGGARRIRKSLSMTRSEGIQGHVPEGGEG